MAHVSRIVREHLRGLPNPSLDSLISDLDLAVGNTGTMLQTIYWQVVDPPHADIDQDQIAASVTVLLAYLGHVGELIDALGALELASRSPVR